MVSYNSLVYFFSRIPMALNTVNWPWDETSAATKAKHIT